MLIFIFCFCFLDYPFTCPLACVTTDASLSLPFFCFALALRRGTGRLPYRLPYAYPTLTLTLTLTPKG